jgi:plastocyanin
LRRIDSAEPAAEAGTTVTAEASTTTTPAFTTEVDVSSAPPGASTVAMLDVRYEPATVKVTAGDVVLWLDNREAPPPPGFVSSRTAATTTSS